MKKSSIDFGKVNDALVPIGLAVALVQWDNGTIVSKCIVGLICALASFNLLRKVG